MGERTFVMVKGPSCLGVNLGLEMECLRFLASSQTLSPLAKGVKLRQVQEAITCCMSSWEANASSQVAVRDFKWDSTVGIEVFVVTGGRA